jgi:hypothetical protein
VCTKLLSLWLGIFGWLCVQNHAEDTRRHENLPTALNQLSDPAALGRYQAHRQVSPLPPILALVAGTIFIAATHRARISHPKYSSDEGE